MLATVTIMAMTTPTNGEYVTAREGLRIRAEPSTLSEVLGVLPFAAEVHGTISDGWMKTEDGYCKASFLSVTNPLDEWTYMGTWHMTAYYETGCLTASGVYPEVNVTAAHNSLPFGTEIYIQGYGIWTVQDRGPSSMGTEWCDLYLGNYDTCVQFGSQYADVWIKETP